MKAVRTLTPILLGSTLMLSAAGSPSTALAGTGSNVSIDRAKVVAAEPVYRTVSYSQPVEQCTLVEEPVYTEPRHRSGYRSYTGPILGAIIGGAVGNAVGHSKTNKKVGTAVGAVLGGTIGRDIQRRAEQRRAEQRRADAYGYGTRAVGHEPTRYLTREVCETVYQTTEEQDLDGYDVTYLYAGQTHTARMDHDPGRYLEVRVRVTPV
jgi:uncharacterized protein YcfJ